jgi:cytochrome P450
MVALTRKMLDGWNDGEVFDIHPEMMGLTLRIAAKTLFDSEMERDIRDIDHAVNDLLVEVASRWKRPVFVPRNSIARPPQISPSDPDNRTGCVVHDRRAARQWARKSN